LSAITRVVAREILDSRGNPTVEVDVVTSDGVLGRASVPSGASTGTNEAVELRDGDASRFGGLGVLRAIENIHRDIAPAIIGRPVLNQAALDNLLIELDGTPDKSRLGGNAIVGVSVAIARAAAKSADTPLYRYLGGANSITLPVPMFNILNGGKHAEGSTDLQEFMVVPAGFETFRRAVQAGAEVFHALRNLLRERGFGTTVGDEGGFAPTVSSNREAIELTLHAIERAGYTPGQQCFIALDVAASELVGERGGYSLAREGVVLSAQELIDRYQQWVREYPIISIEDGMAEDDWTGWSEMTGSLGEVVQLVGDDLYTTNPRLIGRGIERGASNALLVKLNQIGTITETLEAVSMAKRAGWGTVISHRSGETEDTTVADLAVGTAAGQIKAGAPSRGERTAKYNRLLRIEEELQGTVEYAGQGVYESFVRHR
jgi:enolase